MNEKRSRKKAAPFVEPARATNRRSKTGKGVNLADSGDNIELPQSIEAARRVSGSGKVKVAILGGGVAGLSAAHELAKYSGFEVHVFEKDGEIGGKARSQDVSQKLGTNGRTLLGEHGFRFFPHFYKHITQTLKEIPFPAEYAEHLQRREAADSSVWGNLRGSTEGGCADGRLHKIQRPLPSTVVEFTRAVRDLLGRGAPATQLDLAWYSWHILKFLTACQERRDEEYDRVTWAEFVGVGTGIYTSDFETFVRAAPRNLSAMWPDKCSARSCGGTLAQMTFDFSGYKGHEMDAVLTGPTTETWLDAWKLALGKGQEPDTHAPLATSMFEPVRFHHDCEIVGFEFDGLQVTHAVVWHEGAYKKIRGQAAPKTPNEHVLLDDVAYFICALPLEVAQRVFDPTPVTNRPGCPAVPKSCISSAREMVDFDDSLRLLLQIEDGTAPMIGVQFFLQNDAPICHGHVLYSSSPWALTSISQAQFWENQLDADDLEDYLAQRNIGVDGLRGILSVVVSDWDTPAPRLGRAARHCTPSEIKREVWLQLQDALERSEEKLSNEDLLGWPVDGRFEKVLQDNSIEKREQDVEDAHPLQGWTEFRAQRHWQELDAVLVKACHLDENIQWEERTIPFVNPRKKKATPMPCKRLLPTAEVVSTPLFVHPRGSQRLRPDAQLRIPNLLLASDYVRTYTDLATMEAANEAARRAVLAILQRDAAASSELFPKLWPLTEGQVFEAAKALDRLLYLNGQPHVMDSPEIFSTLLGSALDNVVQTGLDFLGLRNRMGIPPDIARRFVGAARGVGRGRANPEMLPQFLELFASSFLQTLTK